MALPAVPWGRVAAGAKTPQDWSWVQAGQALCTMMKAQLPRKAGRTEHLLLIWPYAELPSRQGRCWFLQKQILCGTESEGQLHLQY